MYMLAFRREKHATTGGGLEKATIFDVIQA
jgi:hypothetical protein